MRQKTCKVCKEKFAPAKPMQSVCGIPCAAQLARINRDKKERQDTREKKAKLKRRSDHMREAQQAFNAYIRERDKHQPCISCGAIPNDSDLLTGSRIDAGHYRSTGSCPELRFELLNCNAQCVKCNRNLSGNVVEYRINLIKRIGQDKVDWLEGPHEAKKYTVEDLIEIKAKYRRMKRELERSTER